MDIHYCNHSLCAFLQAQQTQQASSFRLDETPTASPICSTGFANFNANTNTNANANKSNSNSFVYADPWAKARSCFSHLNQESPVYRAAHRLGLWSSKLDEILGDIEVRHDCRPGGYQYPSLACHQADEDVQTFLFNVAVFAGNALYQKNASAKKEANFWEKHEKLYGALLKWASRFNTVAWSDKESFQKIFKGEEFRRSAFCKEGGDWQLQRAVKDAIFDSHLVPGMEGNVMDRMYLLQLVENYCNSYRFGVIVPCGAHAGYTGLKAEWQQAQAQARVQAQVQAQVPLGQSQVPQKQSQMPHQQQQRKVQPGQENTLGSQPLPSEQSRAEARTAFAAMNARQMLAEVEEQARRERRDA